MSRHVESPGCERLLERLEAFIDGDLPADEHLIVETHLGSCPTCHEQHELGVRIRQELRSLPQLDAPPHVIESVLETARREAATATAPWWRALRPSPVWALAAAALLAAVLLPTLTSRWTAEQPSEWSQVEVERAADEARLALAYVSKVSRRAGLEFRDGVLVERLVVPTAESIRSVAPRVSREEERSNEV